MQRHFSEVMEPYMYVTRSETMESKLLMTIIRCLKKSLTVR